MLVCCFTWVLSNALYLQLKEAKSLWLKCVVLGLLTTVSISSWIGAGGLVYSIFFLLNSYRGAFVLKVVCMDFPFLSLSSCVDC